MIRDTFFDWHRFVNVCHKEMVEGWKANLLRMVLMYGVLAIALVWNAYVEYDGDRSREAIERNVWSFGIVAFIWGITVMGCLSASFTMERMKTKTSRMAMLTTPATMFEKFFARWVVFTFVFLVVYIIAYKLADWTRILVFMAKYPEMDYIGQVPLCSHMVSECRTCTEHWTAFPDYWRFMLGVSGYFFFQSCFVLGSSIWPKNAFLKTFAAGVIIVIVYALIGTMLAKLLISDYYVDREHPSEEALWACMTVVAFAMALFNWILAYFRFKESEIINRW